MSDNFTDRARKAMQLANQEAQRFNHEYIGTEHILLGLVKDGLGIAANVLSNMDIDLRTVRMEVERIVEPGPDTVTMGKLPLSPKAKQVVEYSYEEARNFHHNCVGTEHLLLGLLREKEGVAAQLLMNLGLHLEEVQGHVYLLLRGCDIPKAVRRRLPNNEKLALLPMETPDVPAKTRQALAELTNQIHKLNQEQRTAITEHDFDLAGHFRDEAEKLKRKKQSIIHDWYNQYAIDPSWLSWNDGTVVKMARGIYEEQRWEELPILADALEEAGCTDREILDHCRRPGSHASLCWVLVLLLGKT
jgi:ATP-dependent Clp protease ATP-binding subunit ClpA